MKTSKTSPSLAHVSGEVLLLAAIFGKSQLRRKINRELDRRAHLHTAISAIAAGQRQAA
jgi:hypothetical protein